MKVRPAVDVGRMKDPEFFKKCIGTMSYYSDFVRFFQDEIADKGVPHVVNEYLLKGDDLADDILARMHAGESCKGRQRCPSPASNGVLTCALRIPPSSHRIWMCFGI